MKDKLFTCYLLNIEPILVGLSCILATRFKGLDLEVIDVHKKAASRDFFSLSSISSRGRKGSGSNLEKYGSTKLVYVALCY